MINSFIRPLVSWICLHARASLIRF